MIVFSFSAFLLFVQCQCYACNLHEIILFKSNKANTKFQSDRIQLLLQKKSAV